MGTVKYVLEVRRNHLGVNNVAYLISNVIYHIFSLKIRLLFSYKAVKGSKKRSHIVCRYKLVLRHGEFEYEDMQ